MSDESIINEAMIISDKTQKAGLTLKILGAGAIRIHCSNFASLHKAMKRTLTDIDFVAPKKQKKDVLKFMETLGYGMDRHMRYVMTISERYILTKPGWGVHVDIFLDKLDMCHLIDLRSRMHLDHPTIPLADLLLEKTQIVQINEKDIKDVIVLLREHNIGAGEVETINAQYIADLLSKDWGFYYTVTTNLKKIEEFLIKYDVLTEDDVLDVKTKIQTLQDKIEQKPKSRRWKMRAKVGSKKKWYKDVEEVYEREELH
ncbi:MAG: hypothetical protein ACE5R6_11630 [Candidatus Heimdallarchaeota archaeon]